MHDISKTNGRAPTSIDLGTESRGRCARSVTGRFLDRRDAYRYRCRLAKFEIAAVQTMRQPQSPFDRLVETLDYPVYIVTTAAQNQTSGCLVGLATQCSIDPPRFLACISKKNRTLEMARRADVLAVHVVDEKDRHLAELFGGETGDEVDKFARVSWHYAHGVPILDSCKRWFAGTILGRISLGDHVGFLLEPIDAEKAAVSEQLTFQEARDIEPGHLP